MTIASEHPMDQFLTACGVAGPLQLHITSPDGQEVVHLTLVQPFALIGSNPSNDLALSHPQVSRRHAYLQAVGGHVFCVDLQSRTGIRWEGHAERAGWLGAGQSLGVGPYRIQAEINATGSPAGDEPPPAWNPLAIRSGDQALLPEVALEFLNGQTPQSLWPMRATLALVGRLPGCQVRLVEPSVSRFHCGLLRTPLGVWAVDLLGREGVRVNGDRLRQARLENGDLLQVGRFLIRVHCRVPSTGRALLSIRPPIEATVGLAADGPAALPAPDYDATAPALVPASRELAPLAAGLPKSELSETVLVPLFSQFNQMQQQMFDQFHQSVLMMVQMFGALHRDQMGLIREELDRLHQLTQELHTLRAELAKHPPAGGAEAAAPTLASPPSLDAAAAELLARMREMLQAGHAPAAPSGNGGPAPPSAAAAAGRKPPSKAPPPPPPANGPAEPPARDDVHAWLQQRIAAVQQERETRWQKIFNFMLGK